jgi:hypothetical protein
MKNACMVLVRKFDGKRPLGGSRRIWDNIKIDLKEKYIRVYLIYSAQDIFQSLFLTNTVMNLQVP